MSGDAEGRREGLRGVRPRFVERALAAIIRFGRDWLVGFVNLQGFDRAVALGGQAFTALIPLLIVYAAVTSRASGKDFADQIVRVFHLSGSSAQTVEQAFAPPGDVESQVTVIGVFLLVFSALSFTRALQRLYQLTWNQPSLGIRAAKWGLIWLVLVVVVLTVRPVVLTGVHDVARVLLSIAISALLWVATPYVLLGRRMRWQRLAATGLLTGFGMTLLSLAGAIWMPRSVSASAAQFGGIGVAFALLSWLVGGGFVLVVASSGGAVIDRRLLDWSERRRDRRGQPA
jgi:membrane protein